MKKLNNVTIIYILIFFIVILYRIIGLILNGHMILIADEVGVMYMPAMLAGLDWTGISKELSYYGFGYTCLLFPLFRITSNPYIIYWSFMVVGTILLGLAALISYHIFRKYFGIKNNKFCMLLTIVSNMLCFTDMKYINNEPMIVLLMWGIAWLLLIINNCLECNVKKRVYTVLLMLIITYSLMVHIRLYVIWIALFIFIIIYYWVYRKWFLALDVAIPLGLIGFLTQNRIVNCVQKFLWTNISVNDIRNASQSVSENIFVALKDLWDIEQLKSIIFTLFGNIYTIIFFTAGLFCFIFIIVSKILFQIIFKRKKYLDENSNIIIKNTNVLLIFFAISIMITILGLILSWNNLVTKGRFLGYGANTMALKVWVYIRYYSPFVGIVFATSFIYISKTKNVIKDTILPSTILFAIITLVWMLKMVPYIEKSSIVYTVFGAYGMVKETDNINRTLYYIIFYLSFISFVFTCLCVKYRKYNILLCMVAAMIIFRFYYNSAFLQLPNDAKGDGAYNFVKQLEKEINLPEDLYLLALNSYTYPYQFYLNNFKIIKIDDIPIENNYNIIFSDSVKRFENQNINGYSYVKLDENEYLFIKDKELIKQLEKCGILMKRLD